MMTDTAARDLILAAIVAIPAGSVCSYGMIAERAGLPRRARLVARVLAQLPPGSGVPWFRVVRAGGRIAFAPGSSDFARQRERLQAEGCVVSAAGRVTPQVGAAEESLDAAMWSSFFNEP